RSGVPAPARAYASPKDLQTNRASAAVSSHGSGRLGRRHRTLTLKVPAGLSVALQLGRWTGGRVSLLEPCSCVGIRANSLNDVRILSRTLKTDPTDRQNWKTGAPAGLPASLLSGL